MIAHKQHLIQMLIATLAGTIGLMFIKTSFLSILFISLGFIFTIILIKLLNTLTNLIDNYLSEVDECLK
jgi:hypothetical protein